MREWYESRSLLELKKIILPLETIEITPEGEEALVNILKRTMDSDKNRELLFDCIAKLSDLSDHHWVAKAIEDAEKQDFIWGDIDSFATLIADTPGKKVPYLMALTLDVKGEEWYTQMVVELPVRIWKTASKVLTDEELTLDMLMATTAKKFEQKKVVCDHLIWLWRSKFVDEKAKYITHTNIFLTLRKNYVKHFLKAQRALHDLVSDNDKFLVFILDNGDPKKIKSFIEHVHTYRASVGLDEKKMLLRIANLFPDYKKNIEASANKGKVEEVDLSVTSAVSYNLYKGKLKEILDEIPENKKALQYARSLGDFSENSELDAAKERENYLRARQDELIKALEETEVFDFTTAEVKDTVVLGSTVTLDVSGTKLVYHLMGAWDSNPDMNVLSSGSDLTGTIFGKKKGDGVKLPNGKEAVIKKVAKLDKKIAKACNNI